jgi:hypothetical protein
MSLFSYILDLTILPGDMVVCVHKSQKARRYRVEFFAPSPLVCVWLGNSAEHRVLCLPRALTNYAQQAFLSFTLCLCFAHASNSIDNGSRLVE